MRRLNCLPKKKPPRSVVRTVRSNSAGRLCMKSAASLLSGSSGFGAWKRKSSPNAMLVRFSAGDHDSRRMFRQT